MRACAQDVTLFLRAVGENSLRPPMRRPPKSSTRRNAFEGDRLEKFALIQSVGRAAILTAILGRGMDSRDRVLVKKDGSAVFVSSDNGGASGKQSGRPQKRTKRNDTAEGSHDSALQYAVVAHSRNVTPFADDTLMTSKGAPKDTRAYEGGTVGLTVPFRQGSGVLNRAEYKTTAGRAGHFPMAAWQRWS